MHLINAGLRALFRLRVFGAQLSFKLQLFLCSRGYAMDNRVFKGGGGLVPSPGSIKPWSQGKFQAMGEAPGSTF